MRCLVLLLPISLLAGCGNSWIDKTSEAREPARIEARQTGEVGRDQLALPNADRSIKFAIIGDSGRGTPEQREVAAQMEAYRQRFDYKFVLMAGDNIYEGPATEDDYRLKFEEPYKLLLDAGVKFYAALGNHDDSNQIFYKPFNRRRAAFAWRSNRRSSTVASMSSSPGTSTSTSARNCSAASFTSSPAARARSGQAIQSGRLRSRAATIRTTTSCWRRSPTTGSSFRR
jgi:hypothetical protein